MYKNGYMERNRTTWKSCQFAPWRDCHGPLLTNLLKFLGSTAVSVGSTLQGE